MITLPDKLLITSKFNESKNWFDVVAVNMFNKVPPEVHSVSNKISENSLRY